MPTTIEDKIKLFANVIFEKVEKQSEGKLDHARRQTEEQYTEEKERIETIAYQITEDKIKKSESMYTQIISRAHMEARQSLFRKKEELLRQTIKDLEALAREFIKTTEYGDFLRHAVCEAVSGLSGEKQLLFYFTTEDLKSHEALIRKAIADCLFNSDAVYTLNQAEGDIIGGCLCCNEQLTKRAVYTMASLLEDRKELIGQMVMDNLHSQVVL